MHVGRFQSASFMRSTVLTMHLWFVCLKNEKKSKNNATPYKKPTAAPKTTTTGDPPKRTRQKYYFNTLIRPTTCRRCTNRVRRILQVGMLFFHRYPRKL